MLFNNFIVFYDVDYGTGGNYGYAVEDFLWKVQVGYLYKALMTHAPAGKVVADEHPVSHVLNAQYVYNLEENLTRYVVYDDAVLQGSYGQFFLCLNCHDSVFLKVSFYTWLAYSPNARQIMASRV